MSMYYYYILHFSTNENKYVKYLKNKKFKKGFELFEYFR